MKFEIALMISLLPIRALAQTPELDKQQAAIEKFFVSEGVNPAAVKEIYLVSWAYTMNQVCGEDRMSRGGADSLAKMHGEFAKAFGLPELLFKNRVMLITQKMKTVLVANPAEAAAFCKEKK
jgi:hypothetical protein